MMAHDEILDYLGALVNCGLEDVHEFRRKLDGIDEVVKGLRERADRIADEREERYTERPDIGWLVDFNKGER
jgi:hypothetical protein